MPNSFDRFPVSDPLLAKNSVLLSEEWASFLNYFYENLVQYMNEYGFYPVNLTQAQINAIQSPVNGQTLYNLTVDAPQFYQASSSSWKTISFT
jgi:hypothetical protein